MWPVSLLTALIALPVLAALLVWTFPSDKGPAARVFALCAMAAEGALGCMLLARFDWQSGAVQFYQAEPWVLGTGIYFALGVDGFSLLLVLLTVLLAPIALLSSIDNITDKVRDYAACMLLLQAALIGNLLARDVFLFYVFFEAMLLPAYALIGAYGSERSPRAALRFFLYTMAGSMLLLFGILFAASLGPANSPRSFLLTDLQATLGQTDLGIYEFGLLLTFAAAFLVKIPVWPLHGWLPETYGEAPASALVLLSGVMVKLGVLGLLRLGLLLFPRAATAGLPTLMVLAVVGCLYAAWLAAGQSRLRRVIAYGSMSHVSLCVLGLTTMTPLGLTATAVQMVAHGINAAALFVLVGMIERRYASDSFADLGGLAARAPHLATCFVAASLANMGLPGLVGFVGEFLVMASSWQAEGLGVVLTRGDFAKAGIILLLTAGSLLFLLVAWSLYSLAKPPWNSASGRLLRLLGGLACLSLVVALVSLPAGASRGGLLMRLLAPMAASRALMTAPGKFATIAVLLSVILSAAYMLRAIERTCFGPSRPDEKVADLNACEGLTVWPLLIAMVVFGLWPAPVIALAEPTATAMATYFRTGADWVPPPGIDPPGPARAYVPKSAASQSAPRPAPEASKADGAAADGVPSSTATASDVPVAPADSSRPRLLGHTPAAASDGTLAAPGPPGATFSSPPVPLPAPRQGR